MGVTAHVEQGSREVAREHSGWVQAAARIGYTARGILYVVIGVLALQLALGRDGEEADKSGALREIGSKPMGRALVIVLAVAFAAFTLWQLLEATLNFEGHGTWGRLGRVFRALIYSSVTWVTVKYALDSKVQSGDEHSRDVTARLLEWPLGPWIVGAVGAVIIAIGANSGWEATGDRFKKRLELFEVSRQTEKAIVVISRVGLVARMLVFALVGVFIVRAAVADSARQATGLDGALRRLAQLPYGRALLGLLAAGLVAFGVYCFAEARYRRVRPA